MWALQVPAYELIARTIVVYAVFLVGLRIFGKRELGQFTLFDLALILLASNALQPAMTGPDSSIGGGIVILATLFALAGLLSVLRRRSRLARRLLEPTATVIARDGAWVDSALTREGLDDEDLEAALREHGLERIDEVRLAVLEPDGSISVVPNDGDAVRMKTRHRRYHTRPHT